jgi:DNA invertase Pin-like site-specific DNA recombinase
MGVAACNEGASNQLVHADERSFHPESYVAIFSWVAVQGRENLGERMKARVARAREEEKHISRPFREINRRKVDEHRARGYRGRPFQFQG